VLPPPARRAAALPPDDRRRMIVDATLPLLLENGEMVTTRQIAEAAGIAEGTIFRVFEDKDAVITAVIERVLDTEPLEQALRGIDVDQPLERCLEDAVVIIQQRVVDIWRLASSLGSRFHGQTSPQTASPTLVELLDHWRDELSVEPVIAARVLRSFTLSVTHPLLAEEPMSPPEIVSLFLHGISHRGLSC
jgi:AcrR family transcriptional regulator